MVGYVISVDNELLPGLLSGQDGLTKIDEVGQPCRPDHVRHPVRRLQGDTWYAESTEGIYIKI